MSNQTIVDPTKYQKKVLFATVAGYAFDAVDLMVIALTLPLILREWQITMVQGGLIVSAMLVGGVVGGYVFGPVADKVGRKKALVWCIAFFGITTGLGALAQNYLQLAVLRFLAGMGLGAEWALGATMLAEFTAPEKRGRYNSIMQMGWPIGFILALAAQYVLVPKFGWRSLYIAGGSAILIALYIQIAIPESPVWMKAKLDREKGIAAGIPQAAAAKTTDLFKAEHIKTFLFCLIMCICALITYWGTNTWLPTVLAKERGMTAKEVSGFLLALNLVSFPAYALAAVLVVKTGKRLMTSGSAILAGITLIIWLTFPWGPKMFFFWGLACWFTASGLWAGFGAYIAEQFPTHVRAVGVASSFATGRAVVVFVPMVLGAAATATASLATVIGFIGVFYFICGVFAFLLKENQGAL